MTDTVVAVATAAGRGGVGIVRLSGPQATAIAESLTRKALPAARQMALRRFYDPHGVVLDSGLLVWFAAPHSFTGETVVELQGHGGPVVLDLIVRAACAAGARPARPGEFSERAFVNGRLDLAQAEAIADLIDAGSAEAARAAQRSIEGVFSQRVGTLAERLIELRVYVEGALDFSDEDIDWLGAEALRTKVDAAGAELDALLQAARRGRRLRDGFVVALVGRPNVGKSTLLNRLAGADVAIVTDIAGTTRDVLREDIVIEGLRLTLIDTAGLRDTDDPIEREGVRRARLALERSELAVFLTDSERGPSDADQRLLASLSPAVPRLIVHNKIDLRAEAPRRVDGAAGVEIHLSAASGAGLTLLSDELLRRAGLQSGEVAEFSARTRHLDALERTRRHLQAAARNLAERSQPELAAEELRLAHEALGEITGRFGSEDLLGRIFAGFCIGK